MGTASAIDGASPIEDASPTAVGPSRFTPSRTLVIVLGLVVAIVTTLVVSAISLVLR
jgi:hypothetical protein